jgi:hypothetical protein
MKNDNLELFVKVEIERRLCISHIHCTCEIKKFLVNNRANLLFCNSIYNFPTSLLLDSFPTRDLYQHQLYRRNWDNFRALCQRAEPNMRRLNIDSKPELTKFLVRRGKKGETYLLHDEIGAGEFETFRKASRRIYI